MGPIVNIIVSCAKCNKCQSLAGSLHTFPIETLRSVGWVYKSGEWKCFDCSKPVFYIDKEKKIAHIKGMSSRSTMCGMTHNHLEWPFRASASLGKNKICSTCKYIKGCIGD